jgi:drug/metabolite transporter (DMT)-like permease
MPQPATPPFPFAGELAALVAAMIWACTLCTFRRFGDGIPARVLTLYKNCIALVCLLAAIAIVRPALPEDPGPCRLLVLSGVIGLAFGDTAFYAALSRLGAQLTAATQCLAPPVAALLGWIVLSETLSAIQILGMSLTVVAVGGVVLEGGSGLVEDRARRAWTAGLVFAALSALAQAAGIVLQRGAFQSVSLLPGTAIRFAPAVALLALMQWGLARPRSKDAGGAPAARGAGLRDPRRAAVLAVAAFFGTFVGVFLLAAGAKYAQSGVVTALSSTYPIWVIPVAAVFLKESAGWRKTLWTLVAMAGIALLFGPAF